MRKKIGSNEGLRDVRHHESPREVPAQPQVEAQWQPTVCGDGSTIGLAEVVVNSWPVLGDELAREHAEVWTRADQEPTLADLVGNEEVAGVWTSNACRRWHLPS
jgi:hypothetical protein